MPDPDSAISKLHREVPTSSAAARPAIRKVTTRQVKAAQIAVKGYERRGRQVPPGLWRIANAKTTR